VDDELRMLLADHGSPDALANCIADNFTGMRVPVPVEEVAEAVGIVEVNGVPSASFEGILVTDSAKTKGTIAYNDSSLLERRRFTIAHEIGHFLMPSHNASAQCAKADMSLLKSADARKSKEAEANRFAACLLMPKKLYLADMRKLGTPETEHVLRLASRYCVSKEAAARRFTDLSEHSCAIIFSLNGMVRNYCKSANFPFLTAKPKERLPSGCLSAAVKLTAGAMSAWAETVPETWMDRLPRGKTVCEQFLQQANGYGMTMLTLDDAEGSDPGDEDDEDLVERSWAPPRFRK
jgi:hypothetical protein